MEGLKKGSAIKCRKCGEIILKATKDIGYMTPMESSKVCMPDGSPVPKRAELRCQHCGQRYVSISTVDGVTIA